MVCMLVRILLGWICTNFRLLENPIVVECVACARYFAKFVLRDCVTQRLHVIGLKFILGKDSQMDRKWARSQILIVAF